MDLPPYVLQVDALYFQAHENGVSYAVREGKVLNPSFDSRWGGRGKFGIPLPHDCWYLNLQFLHYHSRTKENKSGGKFFPTWGHFNTDQFAENVFNLWRLHLGLVDLFLSRSLMISQCLDLSLNFGLRYSEIRHKLRIDYEGGSLLPDGETLISMKNKFWGIGPLFGLDILWRINCWLGVFTYGDWNLSYGKIYVHQDEKLLQTRENIFKFLNEDFQVRNLFELCAGLELRHCFQYIQGYFRFGWDIYFFPGQNQLVRFTDGKTLGKFVDNQGDLSLSGLSLGLGLLF